MAWRLATWPTNRCPSSVKATTDGVVLPPSAFGITSAWPPSIVAATTELVVPRSIPTAFGMPLLLSRSGSPHGGRPGTAAVKRAACRAPRIRSGRTRSALIPRRSPSSRRVRSRPSESGVAATRRAAIAETGRRPHSPGCPSVHHDGPWSRAAARFTRAICPIGGRPNPYGSTVMRSEQIRNDVTSAGTKPGRARPSDPVVIVASPSGDVMFSDPASPGLHGRALRELADEFTMFHPDGSTYDASEWQLARSLGSGEEIVDEEFFRVAPDGVRTTFRCSSSPVYGRAGELLGAVSIARDVTGEQLLAGRLARLAGLFEHHGDGIVGLDAGWYVTAWSKGAERMYGWTADEVIGRHTTAVADLE